MRKKAYLCTPNGQRKMNERHRKKRLDAWRYALALPRSIWYNFRLLPAKQAVRLPLLVSHRTVMENLSGQLILKVQKPRAGLVKIGFTTCQNSNFHSERTRLNLRGTVVVEGDCSFGAGSCTEVAEGATLTLGSRFNLGPRSMLLCHKAVSIGTHGRISWDCTLMDTDQHALVDSDGNRTNPDREVVIGSNVWIGCNSIITKGTHIAHDCTVAAGARLAGHYDEPMTVLAGNPAAIVRRGVKREQ